MFRRQRPENSFHHRANGALFDSNARQGRQSGEIAFTQKAVRAGIFVETEIKNPKLRQERNHRNMPLLTELDLVMVWFYKDVAPTVLEMKYGETF